MAREAKLYTSSSGSAARGFLKFRANISPRCIRNARRSRKRIEPEIVHAMRSMIRITKNRPRARVAFKEANRELKALLRRWETAYSKENFYRGYGSFWSFNATAHRSYDLRHFKCLLTALVI